MKMHENVLALSRCGETTTLELADRENELHQAFVLRWIKFAELWQSTIRRIFWMPQFGFHSGCEQFSLPILLLEKFLMSTTLRAPRAVNRV